MFVNQIDWMRDWIEWLWTRWIDDDGMSILFNMQKV
jgi:hypothetical protein